jgi:endogenous inhibitor of DNA gyrase (YacG/DUF329 family)
MKVPCDYCGKMVEKETNKLNRSRYHYCSKEHSVLDKKDRAMALKNAFN